MLCFFSAPFPFFACRENNCSPKSAPSRLHVTPPAPPPQSDLLLLSSTSSVPGVWVQSELENYDTSTWVPLKEVQSTCVEIAKSHARSWRWQHTTWLSCTLQIQFWQKASISCSFGANRASYCSASKQRSIRVWVKNLRSFVVTWMQPVRWKWDEMTSNWPALVVLHTSYRKCHERPTGSGDVVPLLSLSHSLYLNPFPRSEWHGARQEVGRKRSQSERGRSLPAE